MSPVQIDMALTVIKLIGNSIQERMRQQNELLELFEKAREEDRDFTEEEVKLWETKSATAIKELEALIPTL